MQSLRDNGRDIEKEISSLRREELKLLVWHPWSACCADSAALVVRSNAGVGSRLTHGIPHADLVLPCPSLSVTDAHRAFVFCGAG